ncbi:hypothetical protein FFLO_03160 [Filobasidium floriforme]|uniref:Zn(2)-C6 fungal-type domain-containing protein n=1 Tax=Filobasidium floriforme TaxID=5210 RepID=A0A8K0JLI6_9TREE|nr:hypothetical protein FFLO_03160 [Filobasidium floriforme]
MSATENENEHENQNKNENEDQDQNHNQNLDQDRLRQAERERSVDRTTNVNMDTNTNTGAKRRRTGSISASTTNPASASTSVEIVGGGGGSKNKPGGNGSASTSGSTTTGGGGSSGSTGARGKKPREQFSCVECFRRKQRCDRRFPCSNCIQRRLPERCLPPPGMTLGHQGQGQGQPAPTNMLHSGGTATVPLPAGPNNNNHHIGTASTGYSIGRPGTHVKPNVFGNGDNGNNSHSNNNNNNNNNINPFSNPSSSSISLSPPEAGPSSRARTSISGSVKPDVENAARPALLNTISGSSSSSFRGIHPDRYQYQYDHLRPNQTQTQLHDSKYHSQSDLERQYVHNDHDSAFPRPRTSAPPIDIDSNTDPTSTLAETTARLSRLERLLSLKDQGYAEKRLRLAEEAVLRLLQVREGEEVDTGLDGALYEGRGHGRGEGAIVGEDKRGMDESEKMGRSRYDYEDRGLSHGESTGSGDPGLIVGSGGTGGMGPIMGDASSDAEGAMQDEGAVELLGDNGYNGATALAALSRAPVLSRVQTSSARNSYDDRSFLSIKNHLSGVSSSLDKLLDLTHFQNNEIRALFAVLPSRDVCETLIENYWREWDWTRCPLPNGVFPSDWRAWFDVDTFLRAHAKVLSEQGSNMMASLALVLSVLALGSVSPTLRSTDGHALSSAIFWAAIKALAYCQSPGSNDSKTMWARAILMRYGDLIRNTQMQWYMKSSWIANAMDQGFHRDGAGFGLAPEVTAERRVIWSHVLHADREWALVLGRPMQINQYSTLMPTEADLMAWPWDYRQYMLARNELTPILERISTLFQELSLKRTPEAHSNGNFTQTDAYNDKTYQDLLTIDRTLDAYMASLPAHFSLDPTKTNDALERRYPRLKVYRQIVIAQVSFVRITMHRPFMLKALRKKKHPYRYSWQRCVDTAVQDLRARKMWTRTFNPSEQRQMFIGAWALFNSAVVLGLSILISVDMAEVPDPDTYQEYIGHLQECVETLQSDLDQGRDDAVSRRERRIMDSLLARLDACTSSAARPKISPRVVETPQSSPLSPFNLLESLRNPSSTSTPTVSPLPSSSTRSCCNLSLRNRA